MASKRALKKGSVAKVGGQDVIRRGVGGRFVSTGIPVQVDSAAVTSTEVRAEREPAVIIGPTPAEIARDTERMDAADGIQEWAPAPAQLTWWQRLLASVQSERKDRKESKAEMAEHLAAVKAGVLQELEVMGAKKGVSLKGSPFSTVMLPVAQKKRPSRWGYIAAALLVCVGLMVWIGSREDSPVGVLGQVETAMRKHDVRAFDAKVDVASVASSLVNQMFGMPEGTPAQMQGMAARLTAFVKPGLADSLKEEMLAVVAGDVVLDDSGNTMLGKLWHALGAEKVRVGNARVSVQDDNMAVAEVPLTRSDLGLTLPLQVVLGKVSGKWEVVDVPNLTAVLGGIMQAEQELDERRQQAVMEAAAAKGIHNVRVESVSKAKSPMPGSSNLMVTLVLTNEGGVAVTNTQIDVAFGDAAGQPMMTTRLTLDGDLPAKARREQVWSVPVNRERATERYVADLPLTALTVTATIVR